MNAVDTNILFYARDSRDGRKQQIAVELIASLVDGALLWQVACEYLPAQGWSRNMSFLARRIEAPLGGLYTLGTPVAVGSRFHRA